jgi:hypothetical protein
MNERIIFYICCCIFLSACVQAPVFKEEGYALIRSNYPIVSLNGAEIEPAYDMDLKAGENTLVIVYHSYQYDYFCTFTWAAVSGAVYEVTDHEKSYPLTLYRWVRKNSLWAIRLDPLDPLQCTQELN